MKRRYILAILAILTVSATGISIYTFEHHIRFNELGLTRSDLAYGDHPPLAVLRTNSQIAAQSYLSDHETALTGLCTSPFQCTLDYSLTPLIRSKGYSSSFYYHHWSLFLPYRLTDAQGRQFIVVVQVTDAVKGQEHDPSRFRGLRMLVLDADASLIQWIEP